ncbi:MAG: DUF5666 domain-containing protein [Nitrospirota bacterium]
MKKAIAILLSVVFIFAMTAVSFAAEKAAAPAVEKKAEATAPAKAAEKKIQVTGDVAAVDAKASTITVKGKKGEIVASVNDKTKITSGKDKKTLADVKVGDKVRVKYVEADGKNTAKSIAILAAPAEKPAAAPAEKKAAPAKKPAGGY